jgi:hypothetical protein
MYEKEKIKKKEWQLPPNIEIQHKKGSSPESLGRECKIVTTYRVPKKLAVRIHT